MEPNKNNNTSFDQGGVKVNWNLLMGAAFLMATSAIGPGFLTQTAVFTSQLAASFGFVILISIIIDIGAQLNVWRVIAISQKRAQDISNLLLPGLGYVVSFLIVLGGLVFNIGNLAGAGLGLNVLFGWTPVTGAIVSAIIGVGLFLVKEAGKAMDRFAQICGFVMIALTLYVAFSSSPPVGEAVIRTFAPIKIDFMSIVTLVGGTVGGYITFAGGHRLLDSGIGGKESLKEVTKGSVTAILITGVMRTILFLAALGIIAKGLSLDPKNPPASVFQLAAGQFGYKVFGIVMWAASITSVIGAAYTSVSFIRTFSQSIERNHKALIIGFIAVSALIFAIVGQPVKVLVLVGALNGLILPITLGTMLVAAYKTRIVGDYKHPTWMTIFGWIIVIVMAYLGGYTLINSIPKLLA